MEKKTLLQKFEGVGHITFIVSVQKEINASTPISCRFFPLFSLLIYFRIQAYKIMSPILRVHLPISIDIIQKHPHISNICVLFSYYSRIVYKTKVP